MQPARPAVFDKTNSWLSCPTSIIKQTHLIRVYRGCLSQFSLLAGGSLNRHHLSWRSPQITERRWGLESLDRNANLVTSGNHLTLNVAACSHKHHNADTPAPSQDPFGTQRDVHPVSQRALGALLPWSGTGDQMVQQLGGPSTWLRRSVVSMAGALVLYNVNTLLSVVAALYWAWVPLWAGGCSNTALRIQHRCAALWRARVVDVCNLPGGSLQLLLVADGDFNVTGSTTSTVQVVVAEVGVKQRGLVRRGEAVELLLLLPLLPPHHPPRVLPDVYVPARDEWLARHPVFDRRVFEDISTRMLTEAKMMMVAATRGREQQQWEEELCLPSPPDADGHMLYRNKIVERPWSNKVARTTQDWDLEYSISVSESPPGELADAIDWATTSESRYLETDTLPEKFEDLG
eukprot:jgi/Mesen1/3227/ME000187S02392